MQPQTVASCSDLSQIGRTLEGHVVLFFLTPSLQISLRHFKQFNVTEYSRDFIHPQFTPMLAGFMKGNSGEGKSTTVYHKRQFTSKRYWITR